MTMMKGKTGLASQKCYAAALGDCDGGVATQEHYISKNLLQRIGPAFSVNGLPWSDGTQRLTGATMSAGILCSRHNNALSELDATIGRFYDALNEFHQGRPVAPHTIIGEHLERWALKVLAGMLSSGNVSRKDGLRIKSPPPDQYLAVLFGEQEMPDGWGFYLFRSPTPTTHHQLTMTINSYPPGDEQEGLIYGITTQILGLYFATAMTRVRSEHEVLWYRPQGLDLGGRAQIDLQWRRTPSSEIVRLDTPSSAPT